MHGSADDDGFAGMAGQVPAGDVAKVREERMQAGFGDGVANPRFDSAVFLRGGVKGLDLYGSKRLAVAGNAVSRGQVIAGVESGEGQNGGQRHAQNRAHKIILVGQKGIGTKFRKGGEIRASPRFAASAGRRGS